jgi:methylaspartate mutase sigma subunit
MKVLLTSTPSDSHTWNLVYMQMLIQEMGHEVVNLGACTPIEEIEAGLHKHRPDAVVVSTVNGHGVMEGMKISGRLNESKPGQSVIKLIGGKLDTTGAPSGEQIHALRESGFDGVFIGEEALTEFMAFMNVRSESYRQAS